MIWQIRHDHKTNQASTLGCAWWIKKENFTPRTQDCLMKMTVQRIFERPATVSFIPASSTSEIFLDR